MYINTNAEGFMPSKRGLFFKSGEDPLVFKFV